jgi:hypothetical protein
MNVVLLPRAGSRLLPHPDNLLPFLTREPGGVAWGSHRGFIAGLAVAWFKDRKQVTERPSEYRDFPRASGPSPREALQEALRRGDMAKAAELYFELPPAETRRLLSPDDSIALANWLAKK